MRWIKQKNNGPLDIGLKRGFLVCVIRIPVSCCFIFISITHPALFIFFYFELGNISKLQAAYRINFVAGRAGGLTGLVIDNLDLNYPLFGGIVGALPGPSFTLNGGGIAYPCAELASLFTGAAGLIYTALLLKWAYSWRKWTNRYRLYCALLCVNIGDFVQSNEYALAMGRAGIDVTNGATALIAVAEAAQLSIWRPEAGKTPVQESRREMAFAV